MEHDKGAVLRRVAIVLSSLPEATAGRLMMSLSSEQQRAIRNALNHLTDVDPLERRRALDGFAVSIRQGRPDLAGDTDAAEIVLSSAALQHSPVRASGTRTGPPQPPSATAATPPPLGFLSDVDDEALVDQVREEHPQTIAIILASIAPAQAARVLSKLSVTTRAEAMRRLAKLDAPSPEVVEDIGSQLKNRLLASGARFAAQSAFTITAGSGATTAGQVRLQAIMAEMAAADEQRHSDSAAALSAGTGATHAAAAAAKSQGADGHAAAPPRSAVAATTSSRMAGSPPAELPTAEAIHARLVALPADQLRQALASVPTRQSLLALCGLPNATAEKVLGSLPRRQARQIRQQINVLGTLELREIDDAKAAVAHAVDQREQQNASAHAAPQSSSRAASRWTAAA